MKNKNHIAIISILLSLLIVAAGTSVYFYSSYKNLKDSREMTYQYAFSSLTTSLSNINTTLKKCLYVTSPSLFCSISEEISKETAIAEGALDMLPFSEISLENTTKFINQVDGYIFSVAKKVTDGNELTVEEKNNLLRLSKSAQSLSDTLNGIQSDIYLTGIRMDSLSANNLIFSDAESSDYISTTMSDIESGFSEFATLVYDGPFSDHIEKQNPVLLQDEEEISSEFALNILHNAFPDINFEYAGITSGKIPCFNFTSEEIYAQVTSMGGYIVTYSNNRSVEDSNITPNDAVDVALKFLSQNGYEHMKDCYWERFENTVTINFAATQNSVILYPDLIKVSVALDTGEIIGIESRGYIMSHTLRENTNPTKSIDEISALISDNLEVLNHNLCIIPSSGKNEILCYEFHCKADDGELLLYINANTGIEEKLLILLIGDNGTLTI